jgi:hypothetical protein
VIDIKGCGLDDVNAQGAEKEQMMVWHTGKDILKMGSKAKLICHWPRTHCARDGCRYDGYDGFMGMGGSILTRQKPVPIAAGLRV